MEPAPLPTGVRRRVEANLAALEMADQLETGRRHASTDELHTLASYTGWGGLVDFFDETDASYTEARDRLRQTVSDPAYHTLRSSILNAHYTPPALAEAIWEPVRESAAGRESLRVLEPGSGNGMFFRTSGLAGAETEHQFVGVEVDETTARISALLHPEAEIHHTGFESTRFAEDSFDLTIGNVPFGDWSLADPRHNTAGLSLHNHFIYKSLAHTAPGGYVALISSRYTMDSKSETARRAISQMGDLVGAVRLPEGAQQSLSGTTVGTDVLILRRRGPDEPAPATTPEWVTTSPKIVTDKQGVPHEVAVNTYFENNPQRVLGAVEHSTNPFGPGYEVTADPQTDLAESVRAQITDITTSTELAFDPQRTVEPGVVPGLHTAPVPAARYGHVRFNSETQLFEEYASTMEWQAMEKARQPAKKDRAETLALLRIRDSARELVQAQRQDTGPETRQNMRDQLRDQWQAYTNRYGPINRRTEIHKTPSPKRQRETLVQIKQEWLSENDPELDVDTLDDEAVQEIEVPAELVTQWEDQAKEKYLAGYSQPHVKALRNDPSLGVLAAVENMDHATGQATPAAMLERDVVNRVAVATSATNVDDAIGISMAERGHIDRARIGELLDTDEAETSAALEGKVFTDPETERDEPAARYLSGDVRQKLDVATEAAEAEPDYENNVAALQAVIPETIHLDEITVNPGVPWLDTKTYERFAAETFGVGVEVTYDAHSPSGKWRVETPKGGVGEDVLYQWGTSHRNVKPWSVLEKTLNSQVFRLTKEDPSDPDKRIPDPQGSDAANDKADLLKARFREWVGEDPERAQAVQDRYNRLFNSIVPADYTDLGESLNFPGLSADRTPYEYQRAAVARALNEPAVLFDHVVGAGKTGSMIMTAMEKRRLGHAAKPAIVVPGHLVGQISGEWKQWYPDAEVMAIPSGLGPDERRELFARAAAGDWDGVVVAETVFEDISIDPTRHMAMMDEDITAVRTALADMEADGASRGAIKKTEKAVKTLEKQYQKLADKPDSGLVFEETGIDYLMVDEAHHYKNLGRTSDVPELDHATGSQRAGNLDYILRAMRQDKTSRAVAEGTWTPGYVPSVALFSTGTPVANKVSEMWVMQKYLRPDLLAERGIEDVNAWGQTFTEQDWRVVATPDGRYQRSLKVTGFANVPELLSFNRAFQDSVRRVDLEVPLPSVIGGERHLSTAEPTEEVQEFMGQLQERVDEIKKGDVDPSDDNVLKVVHEGRMAALDPRLMDLEAPGDGGRPAEVADEIMRIHNKTAQNVYSTDTVEEAAVPGSLQIVFADMSTPKPEDPGQFTMYQQIKDELGSRGMEAARVAFIHDAATDAEKVELFRKARDGEINVLMGSTQKMGTGMNVQQRAVALHHVDPPWRPADVEQREGRILRQGNQNAQVEILAYGTQGTTDTFMWSKLSQKAGFIDQLKNPVGAERTMEDPLAGLDATAANAQAVLSGDSRIGDLLTLESEISTLERMEHQHHAARARARGRIEELHGQEARRNEHLPALRELSEQVTSTKGDAFVLTTPDGRRVTDRAEAGGIIAGHVRRAANIPEAHAIRPTDPVRVGTLGGVDISVYRELGQVHIGTAVTGHHASLRAQSVLQGTVSPAGLVRSSEHLVASTEETVSKWERSAENHRQEAQKLAASIEQGWGKTGELEAKRAEYERLKDEMGFNEADDEDPDAAPTRLTSAELAVLWPAGTKLDNRFEVRAGDVIRIKDGPQGTGYYNVTTGYDEERERDMLHVWLEDTSPEHASPIPNHPFHESGGVQLAARERESLTPTETRRLEVEHEPNSRVLSRPYELKAGMKIQATHRETGQLISGTMRQDPDSHMYDGLMFTPDDPDTEATNVHKFNTWVSQSAGFIQLDYEPSPQHASTDETLSVQEISHGMKLTEDVQGVGRSGQIIGQRPGRFSLEPHAIDPATGEATPTERGGRVKPEQVAAAVELTAAEKRILGSTNDKLVGTVEAADLRVGDQVPWRDLDNKATTGDPVRIMHHHSSPYQSKASVSYRDPEGNRQSTDLPKNREMRVTDRTVAALTMTELAQLRCGNTVTDHGEVQPGATRILNTTLIDSEELREVIGTGNPDVIMSYTENGVPKVAAGRLDYAEANLNKMVSAHLINDHGEHTIKAHFTDLHEVAVPREPLDVSELNIGGPPPEGEPIPTGGEVGGESGPSVSKRFDQATEVAQHQLQQQQATPVPASQGLSL